MDLCTMVGLLFWKLTGVFHCFAFVRAQDVGHGVPGESYRDKPARLSRSGHESTLGHHVCIQFHGLCHPMSSCYYLPVAVTSSYFSRL